MKRIHLGTQDYLQMQNLSIDRIEYGLIWNWRKFHQKKYLGQWGTMPGIHHQMLIDDDNNLGILLLSNVDLTFRPPSIQKQISDAFIEICLSMFEQFSN